MGITRTSVIFSMVGKVGCGAGEPRAVSSVIFCPCWVKLLGVFLLMNPLY